MKSSIAVQAFKSITSRIHPQLPLSPKESQRLLNALNSSFNHHLNQEFPTTSTKSSSDTSLTRQRDSSVRSQTASSSSSHNTDIHLASILTNPLFGRPAHGPSPANAALSQLKTKSKHPVQVFEDAVARGQATIDIARLCLNAFRVHLSELSVSEREAHIRDLAAGTRALRWLWSSGKIHGYAFAEDRRFVDILAYFLVAEANESALWNLIETDPRQGMAKEAHISASEMRRRKGLILSSLVKAHLTLADLSPNVAFPAALSAFLRASDGNQSSHSMQPHTSLAAAGALLSRKLVTIKVTDASSSHPVPEHLYNRFIESCPVWDKSPSDRALYRVAALKLHHPVSPSARDALYFIRHLKQSPKHPFLSPSTEAQKVDVHNFLFDTVHLLQAQASHDDASWVMEFMQEAFPQHFATQVTSTAYAQPQTVQPDAASTPAVARLTEPMLSAWRVPDLG